MSLPAVEYIEWIEGRPAAVDHDLGTSDLRGAGRQDPTRLVPERLEGLADPGGLSLAEMVADAYAVDPESVLVTPGASLANLVAAVTALGLAGEDQDGDDPTTTSPGDLTHEQSSGFDPTGSVLVEKPAYEPLVDTPELFGARVDRFLRRAKEDWRLDPERIAAAAVEDTALVTATNRHNPTGRLTDRETLRAAAETATDAGARLLVDEVYAPYVVDPVDGGEAFAERDTGGGIEGERRPAFGGVTAAGIDGTVVTGSLTKFHGLGDLCVGWLIADEAFVDRARQVAQHFPSLPGPSRTLGRRALAHRDNLEAESRSLLARNADLLARFVRERDDLTGPVYQGASYALLEHDTADGDTVAEAALDRGLLVVPGRFFERPDGFRVSLGRDTHHVREALDVLGGTLDAL